MRHVWGDTHPSHAEARARLNLLGDVVRHKRRFFASASTHDETVKLGALRLAPSRGYVTMMPTIIGELIQFNVMSHCL